MKVLIVDDHNFNRELLQLILEDNGYSSVQVSDGAEACRIIDDDDSIDLVLMDVMMPNMDGIEATRIIKTKLKSRFLPILFVTGLDDEKNLEACLEAGGDDFLPKPICEGVLIAKLRAHARSKALYDELRAANEKLKLYGHQIDREHSIVERIFKNGSDQVSTVCDNVNVYTSSMSMFNGDMILVAPSPSGGVYSLIGDFTGHGLAASVGSLPVTEIFYNAVAQQMSVSKIAFDINQRLKILLPSYMFFCAAIIERDAVGANASLWMGGMNDLIVIDDDKDVIERICSDHMPLGILTDDEFDTHTRKLELNPRSRYYAYTDGVTETENKLGEQFGQLRLEKCLLTSRKGALDSVLQQVRDFCPDGEQKDDLSIVEVLPGPVVHRDKQTGDIVNVARASYATNSIPWELHLELGATEMRQVNVVDQVVKLVTCVQGMQLHQDKIFTIISELYSNALEHGVLRLRSELKSSAEGFDKYYRLRKSRLEALKNQSILIDLVYKNGDPGCLCITVEDSGDGFNIREFESSVRDDSSYGRGIKLLQSMCSLLEYSNDGRMVKAVYMVQKPQ